MFGFDSFWPIVGIILGFGLLIFVHELGHFLAAKAVGIRATQFAIGFGQALLCYRKGIGLRRGSTEGEYVRRAREHLLRKEPDDKDDRKLTEREVDEAAAAIGLGETEYRLNWMPLGGYVKMRGQEDLDPNAASDDPRSFNRKAPWARAIVISAGVVMNLIFAVLFFIIAFMIGVDFPAPVIGGVAPDSPAAEARFVGDAPDDADMTGLRSGDRVLSVNGEPVHDFLDLRMHVALARTNSTLDLLIERDTHDQPLTYRVDPEKGPLEDLLWLGVAPSPTLRVAQVLKGEQLAMSLVEAGVEPGMTLMAVDGTPVSGYHELERLIKATQGRAVTLSFANADTGATAQMTVQATPMMPTTEDADGPNIAGILLATQAVDVIPDSPAAKAGVQPGDVLHRVGALTWPTQTQTIELVQQRSRAGQTVTVEVWRDGQVVKLGEIRPSRQHRVGIQLSDAWRVHAVLPDSPFAPLDLPPGATITHIDGVEVKDIAQAARALQIAASDALDEPVEVEVRYALLAADLPTVTGSITLTPRDARTLAAIEWIVPVELTVSLEDLMVNVQTDSPLAATKLGIAKTHQFMVQTYLTLTRLLQGSVPVKSMRGPLGIVHVGTRVSQRGFPYLLFFLGMISVNLVVINFLPIPILDGGLMVFLIIEKLKGSPVSARVQTAATIVGLALIASIFLVVTYYDITRLGD